MRAQQASSSIPSALDAARSLRPVIQSSLSEQYIWTAGDVTVLRPDHSQYPWNAKEKRIASHFFRGSFQLSTLPPQATLYLAGPRDAEVFLNGHLLGHFASNIDAPIGFRVFHIDAASLLKIGTNSIAVRAIRGRGIVAADASPATQQLAYGEVLVVKLLAAAPNREGPVLAISDTSWRSSVASINDENTTTPQWAQPSFNDSVWKSVSSLGPVESDRNFFQWSADAGMYAWPGYQGVSLSLGTYDVLPIAVTHLFTGRASFQHTESLTNSEPAETFAILSPANAELPTDEDAPSMLLDFGRETAGRLLVESASNTDAVLSIAYGEDELEALATGLTPDQRGGNYLGTNLLEVPAHGVARGPKSAFRYVRIRFLRGASRVAFRSIRVEGIEYPVRYAGSFESSDALLNRIWETGAYTVHLCMQDDLWDAPKRDRGRWAGDIDVEGRVISTAFGDKVLLEQTLSALASKKDEPVNGIPGYSALWIASLASLYDHSGDLNFLRSQHDGLLRVLAAMDASLDLSGAFTNRKHQWLFVDWAPDLYGYTLQAVLGTNLQYLRGYEAAARLLDTLDDHTHAEQVRSTASRLLQTIPSSLASNRTWQINALRTELDMPGTESIWADVLSHVKQDTAQDQQISPYFNLSVLDAMTRLGHARSALDWMRTYWGGMLAEGATTFWESYDLRWPKDTPHLSLQADGTSGFFVSLAHGWSSGPTAWLSEQVLGVRNPADGYRSVTIAPRLLGLAWARGSVPTPHGVLRVTVRKEEEKQLITFEIPPGIEEAKIFLEPPRVGTFVLVDNHAVTPAETTAEGMPLPNLEPGLHSIVFTPQAQ
jgi:alpha-L-rhamnosidase